ncbi:hypothetical protein [Adlercreutzia caecimuris]|uniref:YARHG domain-containing protein n=1 Tax=Adlercreutzia caecimuris B7 TaxID=1235794 RepID=R9KXX6_9ACTN|nr:hypothetical protein [Adlercreutzia caecimuris]EOS51158.1 hypothetical protein C811_01576 [Adlercreutzia caecimuris B7]
MTALKRNAGAFLLAAAMAVLLCLAVTPGSAFGDDAISKTTIGTAAEEYLESMANLLATGTPEQESAAFIRAKKSISDSEMQRELRKEICNWRERLKPDVEYSSASSNLTIEAQRVDEDGRILVDAIEETMLINKHSGVEQRFGGRHVFVFEGQGKDWTLVEDRQIDPTGLLPEGKDLRFVYGGEEEVSPGEEGDAVALSEISGEPVDCLPEVEASTAKPEDLGEDASQIAPQAVAPTGYDAIKAAKYLEKYYLHPNIHAMCKKRFELVKPSGYFAQSTTFEAIAATFRPSRTSSIAPSLLPSR